MTSEHVCCAVSLAAEWRFYVPDSVSAANRVLLGLGLKLTLFQSFGLVSETNLV